MNHVFTLAAQEAAPVSHPGSVRRILTAIKNFICGSDELPVLIGPRSRNLNNERAWTITSRLTRDTAQGIIYTDSVCRVRAASEQTALKAVATSLKDSHMNYRIATMRADLEPSVS